MHLVRGRRHDVSQYDSSTGVYTGRCGGEIEVALSQPELRKLMDLAHELIAGEHDSSLSEFELRSEKLYHSGHPVWRLVIGQGDDKIEWKSNGGAAGRAGIFNSEFDKILAGKHGFRNWAAICDRSLPHP